MLSVFEQQSLSCLPFVVQCMVAIIFIQFLLQVYTIYGTELDPLNLDFSLVSDNNIAKS